MYSTSQTSKKSNNPNMSEACAFLNDIWRWSDKVHQIGSLDRQSKSFSNLPVKDIHDAASQAIAISDAGRDSYFACAHYIDSSSRTAKNVHSASAFWMDIDCGVDKARSSKGYLDADLAIKAVQSFCEITEIPLPTHTVSSGGGVHVYWALSNFINRDVWQDLSKKIKMLTKHYGLLADDTRTADISSVLRIPGTFNYKYNPPTPVSLIEDNEALDVDFMCLSINYAFNKLDRIAEKSRPLLAAKPSLNNLSNIQALLSSIDPDCGRSDWIRVGMAIFHESEGSEDGFALWNSWSETGKKYGGEKELRVQWASFSKKIDNPVTFKTIKWMVEELGLDPIQIISDTELFTICDSEEVNAPSVQKKTPSEFNPLDKYSLRGKSIELEKDALEELPILGQLALKGQSTIFYAAPNTGKTLITLHMIIDGIDKGYINPEKLYYINVDDTSAGLIEKIKIAEEYGFHMLAEGYRDFRANDFLENVKELIATNQCRDVVIILDTLKKCTNLMDKAESSRFSKVIRPFITKGGSLVALAHTNKNLSASGQPVFGGTSDIVDDSDCAYTISSVASDNTQRLVKFVNLKRRGNVLGEAGYSYKTENGLAYIDVLLSVSAVDPEQIALKQQSEEVRTDAEVIEAIKNCIKMGINTKMKIVKSIKTKLSISNRSALNVLEKYSGIDPVKHIWNFKVVNHGAQAFYLLDIPIPRETEKLKS